jgi:hypothetical protein
MRIVLNGILLVTKFKGEEGMKMRKLRMMVQYPWGEFLRSAQFYFRDTSRTDPSFITCAKAQITRPDYMDNTFEYGFRVGLMSNIARRAF